MKAVFLDRDGVVNIERGDYTFKLKDFEFNEGFFEFCKKANEKNFSIFIISNQGGIAKGIYTVKDVEIINQFISEELKKRNINLIEIYYCPHHTDFGNCLCRKPNSLLLEKAIAKYEINKENSFLIGDRPRDIEAAQKVGIQGVLIKSNTDLRNYINLFD